MDFLRDALLKFNIDEYGVCAFDKLNSNLRCSRTKFLPQNSKSVITCLFPYYSQDFDNRNISRYAICDNYHDIVMNILNNISATLSAHYKAEFIGFCDISPIDEKQAAIMSGLGIMGKNSLVINKKYGTYFFIGEIVTSYEFEYAEFVELFCSGCNSCIAVCPAKAIDGNGVDFSRCISALTQRKGELSEVEKAIISDGKSVWGCDKCQDCCPHNKNVTATNLVDFLKNLAPVLGKENMSTLIKSKAYGYKGEKLLNRNLDIIKE